jgi:hypothetical protein
MGAPKEMKVKGALIAHRHTASSCISPLAIGLAVAVAIFPRESAGGADRGTGLPHVISCSPDDLAAAKTSLASGDTRLIPALQQLLRDADQGLRQAAVSVLEKETSVDGAAPRDYVSFAPYWWPNPNSADGLPYIRKDGQHNRDRRALGDVGNFSAVKRSVSALALGYYFTDDTRYARHAADLLRAWFLDPKTGMNPNLNHAQAVPGVATGRPAGLIEFRDMPQLLDSLGLLERSPDWGEPDRKAMRAWLTSYYDWLTTNPMALKEQKAANNHGTWYDVQAAALALYIDRPDDARRIAHQFGPNRIASQVEADGRQPRELARVDSWGYSTFNVAAMISMAELAERVGVDIWRFQTGDGRSVKAAIGYLTPYLEDGRKWPHDQGGSGSVRRGQLSSPLLRAMRGLGPESYERFYLSFPRSERETRRERLLYDRR